MNASLSTSFPSKQSMIACIALSRTNLVLCTIVFSSSKDFWLFVHLLIRNQTNDDRPPLTCGKSEWETIEVNRSPAARNELFGTGGAGGGARVGVFALVLRRGEGEGGAESSKVRSVTERSC